MNTKWIPLPALILALAWPAAAQAHPRITATSHVTAWSPLIVGIVDSQGHSGQIVVRRRPNGRPVASIAFSDLYHRADGTYSLYWHWARHNAYTRRIVTSGRYWVTVRLGHGPGWRRGITVVGAGEPASPAGKMHR